ncbi:hypothetical protein [Flavobacterium terrigena]|uniref:Uncharacterized protein n=1 Tax=Flavobacterium terrigena TaxID=402734 RepID=A0A1H6SS86_9FLAO|nr:hypothetical protein [Flavobacterium terrigena]SEI70838.1 hypothetical protein SAMN05660918_1491 [Flavobacterium terrigena]
MLPNLLSNPLHFFHLLYFEDFLNNLKNDYNSQRVYLGELLSNSDDKNISNESQYIKIIFKEIRKLIVNNILKEVSSLNEFEIEDYIYKLNDKINNYKEKNNQLIAEEEYSKIALNEIEYIIEFIQVNYKEVLENIEIKKNTTLYFSNGDDLVPFKFIDDLLFSDGFYRLRNSYEFKTIHTKDYKYIFHTDEKIFFESWVMKNDLSIQMDFPKYSSIVINFYAYAGLDIINKNSSNADFKSFLIKQLDTLYNYYTKLEDLKSSEFELINNSINSITSTLYSKYKSLNVNHKLYRIIIEGTNNRSDFKPKNNLKADLFIDLYEMSEKLEMFDIEDLSEEDFLNILVFKDTSDVKKLKFTKPNPYVAYYLKSLELFFDNLTPLAIEKSELFLNKQNKLIKSSDLYTALSRGKIDNSRMKIDIDSLIEYLTKKYIE